MSCYQYRQLFFEHPQNCALLFELAHRANRTLFEAFTVFDAGPGIAAEAQEKIFEEFVQLDNDSRDRRQGLGMDWPFHVDLPC
jgi:signal transduction histidine kinase